MHSAQMDAMGKELISMDRELQSLRAKVKGMEMDLKTANERFFVFLIIFGFIWFLIPVHQTQNRRTERIRDDEQRTRVAHPSR